MIDRKAALLHARRAVFERRVEQARRIIEEGLGACERPYVACSLGKDSAALLHLVHSIDSSIPSRFLCWVGESEHLNDYARVAAEWRDRFGVSVEVFEASRLTIGDTQQERWGALSGRTDGYFIGLRAEESPGRAMTLRKHGVVYRNASGMLRISPLAWWKTLDVAAYIETHQLPTLSAYRQDGWSARTSARVPRESVRGGVLAALKQRDPTAFNALCDRFPEVRGYA